MALRTFSMSAGLAASTVTPGIDRSAGVSDDAGNGALRMGERRRQRADGNDRDEKSTRPRPHTSDLRNLCVRVNFAEAATIVRVGQIEVNNQNQLDRAVYAEALLAGASILRRRYGDYRPLGR